MDSNQAVLRDQLDNEDSEEVPSTHMPHLLSEPLDLIEATIGESVTFPCDVDDLGDFVVLWKKGKSLLFAGELRIVRDDRIKLNKTSLVVTSVLPKDSGEYACQISTSPPLELAHNLDVLYPPSVKPRPRDGLVTVKEGETVTLSCEATGNPQPVITWKHSGRNYDSYDGDSYHISSAQKSDSGEYECIADNRVGDPASTTIIVEVVAAPKVYAEPKSGLIVVKEGEEISISCEASGDPTPTISWKKPGSDKLQQVREKNRIVISEANRSHAGSYECVASNSLGISTSAIIRVQVLYAPEIQVPNSWVHAKEGTNVNISCIIRGEPVPSMMWKKADGQVIHNSEHYHLKTLGHLHTLQIRDLKEEDFGRYECAASNSLSSASENVHIIGTPQVPIFTSKPHGSQGSKYTLSWTVDSLTPVDEYSVMYRKKSGNGEWETKTVPATEESENDTHTQMFQLVDLKPGTLYEAVVTARNKFGWSKQSEALVFSTRKDELSSTATSEEVTMPPAVTENDMPVTNDKHSDSITSSSSTSTTSLMSMFPFVIILYIQKHL
ncbi:neural cell adhesion molecule 1-like isoform X2 [Stegodyphus dumicola]|uniref:neural cell adhesion molecule 1-like isoform X2 n=1 Tax=Stegodyphus dumicola TaxID=202533 RepID=UPI0015A86F4B|nr:neural cell adhesion molecule 1-like isoform X2 [Stegodyphus dumicola]